MLKEDTIKADWDYLNAMDEIDKLKEKLRQQWMNTDIRHKYVYQNLMGDKIDLLNKWPPIPITLPPWKTLNPICSEIIQNSLENYTNPYLYDYTNTIKTEWKLDAQTMPLGWTTILGMDLKTEQDQLDKAIMSAWITSNKVSK